MVRRLALVVSIALCALVLPGAAPPTVFTPGAPGVGDPYYPLDGNGGYDVRHYDLDLTYDPETDELSGTATIEARATQNLSAFNLDFIGLTVDSVAVDGASAAWTRDGQELTIAPTAGIKNKAAFTVAIAYHGVPEALPELGGPGSSTPTTARSSWASPMAPPRGSRPMTIPPTRRRSRSTGRCPRGSRSSPTASSRAR